MSVLSVNKNNFEALKAEEKPVLLDFYADWCGPCRMLSPVIHEIGEERTDIVVGKINVDEEPELAEAFRIEAIPTLVAMKNGRVTGELCGAYPKEKILKLLK